MMKLIVSLLGLFTSISNGASGCDMNTKLSNTCGTLTVSGVKNADIDGKYKRIDDCLFQKTDGSDNYISEWAGRYVGTELGDRRCERKSGSYRVVFDASVLDDLIVGEAETFKPTWPSSRTVTISCDSASDDVSEPEPEPEPKVTPSPTPEAVIDVDNICLIINENVELTSGSGIVIKIPLLAGEYEEISGGKNGKPAWKLVSECGTSSTLMYVPLKGIEKYMFVRDSDDAFGTYYFSCETDDILTDGCPGSMEDYIGLSIGMDCVCGLSTPAPVPAPEAERVDDLCIIVDLNVKVESGSGIVIQLPELAGNYEEIPGGKNGYPAWKLDTAGPDCDADETASTLMYVDIPGIEKYMFVRDSEDPFSSYYFSCDTDDILADGCPGNLQHYIGMSMGGSCVCGQS